MLNLYRRHTPKCPHRHKGRGHTGCSCPIWADGMRDGRRFGRSLGLRDWQRAIRKLAAWESPGAPELKPVREAVEAFLIHCRELAPATLRKYTNVMRQFQAFCEQEHVGTLAELSIDVLERYRAGRPLARTTSGRELQTLRQFFALCVRRKWMADNPAREVKMPPARPQEEQEPFTAAEVSKMLAACDQIGRGAYERIRARVMILVLRYTGLRISDVATLARSRVKAGQMILRAQKNGGLVLLPIPSELEAALAQLPAPRGVDTEPEYFFWNGRTSKRAVVGIAERTLAAVFKKAAVVKAHAHRFRHTLATDLLVKGATEQDVADVLGISPNIVRKHYAKWTPARQERVLNLLKAVHAATFLLQPESQPVIH